MYSHPRPRSWISVLVVLAALGLMACSGSGTTRSAPAGPTTTTVPAHGPFAVGRRTVTFVDATRTTSANGRAAAKPTRALETIVEYPAAGAPDPAHEAAGAAPLGGLFPVAIYVHGLGAHADNPYLHYWASAGFIAVAPKFPLTNTDTPGGPNAADGINEPTDINFIIEQLRHLPPQHADLESVTDAANVGLFGESFGAGVVMTAGLARTIRDPAVKAVVGVAGSCAPCLGADTPAVPLMLIQGDADPFQPYAQTAQTFAAASSPKYFLTLIGAKHVQFGPPWEPIAARASIDFFARYLRRDTAALLRLRADANVPGTTRLTQG